MSHRYWFKIGFGALVVFLLGFTVYRAGHRGKMWAEDLANSASPISIPMAFVPFRLDGRDLGTIKRLDILRDSPHSVSGARVTVRLAEGAEAPSCALTVTETHSINNKTMFRCADDADVSAMVPFGRVLFEPDTERDLYLPTGLVEEWRHAAPQREGPSAPPAPAEQGSAGASLQFKADRQGVALNVVDALAQAGVQLLADSTGAIFHVRDDASNTHVAMRADAGGFALQVIDRGETKVVMQADSTGVRMNVQERP